MTPQEIHHNAEAAYVILEQDFKTRFMTSTEKRRAETVLRLIKEIEEGTA